MNKRRWGLNRGLTKKGRPNRPRGAKRAPPPPTPRVTGIRGAAERGATRAGALAARPRWAWRLGGKTATAPNTESRSRRRTRRLYRSPATLERMPPGSTDKRWRSRCSGLWPTSAKPVIARKEVLCRRAAVAVPVQMKSRLVLLSGARTLTGHVQNGVGGLRILFEHFDSVDGRQNDQFDLAALRLAF